MKNETEKKEQARRRIKKRLREVKEDKKSNVIYVHNSDVEEEIVYDFLYVFADVLLYKCSAEVKTDHRYRNDVRWTGDYVEHRVSLSIDAEIEAVKEWLGDGENE